MEYQIKVTLPFFDSMSTVPASRSPYRVLAVKEDMRLHQFGQAILEAFDFSNDHYFGFYDELIKYTESKTSFVFTSEGFKLNDGSKNIELTTVSELLEDKKDKLFVFDYGDNWNFWLSLVDVTKLKADIYPRIIKVFGTAPKQYETYDEYENDD